MSPASDPTVEGPVRRIDGLVSLDSTWTIDEPTLVQGGEGALITGSCRDALVRVRSRVRIEGVHLRRTARADGAPSWGSLIVVEAGGALELVDCTLEGAAHAFVVDPSATLTREEAWAHAGLDVRGTGHAVATRCVFRGNAAGARASIFPADRVPNVALDRCRIEGCDVGVHAVANARVRVKGCEIVGGATSVLAENDADVQVRDSALRAPTSTATLANGGARLRLSRVQAEACAFNAVQAQGRARVTLQEVALDAVKSALYVADAAQVDATSVEVLGSPEWAVYAELAGVATTRDCKFGAGRVDVRHAAQIGEILPPPIDEAAWLDLLDARADLPADIRRAAVERLSGAVGAGLGETLRAWSEVGRAGLGPLARTATEGVHLVERSRVELGSTHAVVALAPHAGGWLVATRRGEVIEVRGGEKRWTARVGTATRALMSVGTRWLAIRGPSQWAGVELAVWEGDRCVGRTTTGGPVVAVAFGDPITVVWVDRSGHPTDRCTWRAGWSPPAPPSAPEAVAQGEQLPEGTWDWLEGATPRAPVLATLSYDGLDFEAREDALRAFAGGRPVLRHALCGVTALAALDGRLWAGTRGGALVELEVVPSGGVR